MVSQFNLRFKGLVVEVSELMEIDAKLHEMLSNVGVSFSERETSILKQALRVTSEVCDNSGGESGLTSMFENQVSMMQRNVDLILADEEDGFCYTKLLTCLPSMHTANPLRVAEVLSRLKDSLGRVPEGLEVFTGLVLAEGFLANPSREMDMTGSRIVEEDLHSHTGIAGKILESPVRFSYKEEGGLFHIGKFHRCEDVDSVMCEHNFWATRFILPVVTRAGTRVGADVDLSALFVERPRARLNSDQLSRISEKTEYETVLEVKKAPDSVLGSIQATQHKEQTGRGDGFEDMDRELTSSLAGALDSHLEGRTMLLERALNELTAATREAKEMNDQIRKSSELGIKGSAEAAEIASTISPNDSSSVVERYQRHFIDRAAYNMRATRTELEPLSLRRQSDEVKEVVGGYMKTAAMVVKEEEQKDRVYLINGLAAPFKSSRLNFLSHFHTALQECSFNPKLDPIDALQEIGSARPKNPTGELMRQVVQRTFDFDDMVVVANPFRIPFIEVGMCMTDTAVMKSLDLMLAEYKTCWFQELKCLRVPEFHNDYSSYTTTVRDPFRPESRRRRRSATRSSQSVSDRGEGDSAPVQARRQGSLLGFRR